MTHEHYGTDSCTAVSDAVCLSPVVHGTETPGQFPMIGPDHLAGFLFHHDREGFAQRCGGYVRVCECQPGTHRWGMTGSLDGGDLTLTPSILCRLGPLPTAAECGFHGFVQAGKWVPA